MPRRLTRFLALGALQLVALVLAHELVFLARYGSRFGEALVHAGHGATWSAAVATSLALGAALAAIGALKLARLGLLVRRHAPAPSNAGTGLGPRPLLRAWLRIAPRMAMLTVVLLSIQENLEQVAIGQVPAGPALLLTPEYAGGLWITIATALAVGLVAALFDWRRRILLARLRTVRASVPRGGTVRQRRAGVLAERPLGSLLGRRSALRAPPIVSVS